MSSLTAGDPWGPWRTVFEDGRLTLWARRPVDPSFRFGAFDEGLPILTATTFPGAPILWRSWPSARPPECPDPVYMEEDPRHPPAVQAFQATIPKWAHALATPVERRRAWALMAQSLAARDLRRSHPVLFLLALTAPTKHREKLFALKRRDILGQLGLPAEESLVRLLGRLDPKEVRLENLTVLRKVLKHETLRGRLGRLPNFPLKYLDLFAHHPDFFDTEFFRAEIEKGEEIPPIPPRLLVWRKACRIALRTGGALALARLAKVPEWARVTQLMESWDRIPQEGLLPEVKPREREEDPIPFPEPLVAKGGPLVPITDSRALLAEGEAMRHCVGTYTTRILRGECDIYQVRHGQERATLELLRLKGKPWLGDLRSFRNQPVSPALREALMAYLAEEAPTACAPPPQKETKTPRRGRNGRS